MIKCWWDDLSWWEQAYMLMRWFIMARTSLYVDEMIYHGENKLTCWWDDLSWREQAYMLMRWFIMARTSTKDCKIGMCCLFAKQASLRRKREDWFAQNQNNASEWSNMWTHGENKPTCWWDDLSWREQADMLMRWFIMARTSWHVDEMIYHGENKLTCWWDDLSAMINHLINMSTCSRHDKSSHQHVSLFSPWWIISSTCKLVLAMINHLINWDDLSWREQAYMLMRWFIMARTSLHVDEMIYHGENKLTCWWDDLSWREQADMLMVLAMINHLINM
jgi:hypothetical protein